MKTPSTPPAEPSVSGIAELTHLGVIRATGADAASFLQGQLTQDVLEMGASTARLAAFCNAKGRMQASFIVFKRKSDDGLEEVLLICSADLLAQTMKRLSMFVMRASVKLSDASADYALYGLVGDAINLGASCPQITWSKNDFKSRNYIFLYPGAGQQRVICCAPVGLEQPSGEPLPLAVWQFLEVQSGVAMISLPTFEAFVPQMLNYESVGAVNFKKGCYPGQEVVARSQFRGTLKRRAYIAHGLNPPQIGQEVFHSSDADQPCGLVAACAPNPSGGFDAIVSMQTAAALGGQLTLGSSQGSVLGLLPLPYALLEDV